MSPRQKTVFERQWKREAAAPEFRAMGLVASPGNEVRGHNMNFSSPFLPGIFYTNETVLICFT